MDLSVTDQMIDLLKTVTNDDDSSSDNSSGSLASADSILKNKMGTYEATFGERKQKTHEVRWIKVDTYQEELQNQLLINNSSADSNNDDNEESKELRPERKDSFIALGMPKMKPPLAHLMMQNRLQGDSELDSHQETFKGSIVSEIKEIDDERSLDDVLQYNKNFTYQALAQMQENMREMTVNDDDIDSPLACGKSYNRVQSFGGALGSHESSHESGLGQTKLVDEKLTVQKSTDLFRRNQ